MKAPINQLKHSIRIFTLHYIESHNTTTRNEIREAIIKNLDAWIEDGIQWNIEAGFVEQKQHLLKRT